MNATAEAKDVSRVELDVGSDINETAIHEPRDSSGTDPKGSDVVQAGSRTPGGRYMFASGARPLEGYTIKRAIGRGGFGEVYFATSDSGKEVALKLILRNLEIERRGVMQCMNLKCPNLLSIFDLKTTDEGDTFVVMEYVSGPSLSNVLAQHPNGLPIEEVRRWMRGLIDGVSYLHDHGIVHRDLKPANLFMEEGIVKIGDYGLAKLISASRGSDHSESIGTCHYMAPEIGTGKYHKPIDVYAIGVILYEMLTGCVPFEGETVAEVLMKHLTARPDVSVLAEPYRSIVARALAKDPNDRPSRLRDLLPAEDAPLDPEVRIIGEPYRGAEYAAVHQAGAESRAEEIFYIGPDTRPADAAGPRTRAQDWRARRSAARDALRARIRANLDALTRPPRYQTPPAAQPQMQAFVEPVAAQPFRLQAAAQPVQAVPEPPPKPTRRMIVAELTGSMLASALLVALFSVPAMVLMRIDPSRDPALCAYFALLSLLGTWVALVPNKLLERTSIDLVYRRLVGLVGGMATGAVAIVLFHALKLEWPLSDQRVTEPQNFEVVYFGLLYTLTTGWFSGSERTRSARFRMRPVVWTVIAAAVLASMAWPYQSTAMPIAIATVIPIVIQLVSPWDETAAAYRRYLATATKRGRRLRI